MIRFNDLRLSWMIKNKHGKAGDISSRHFQVLYDKFNNGRQGLL
jgi:hypothetical protein